MSGLVLRPFAQDQYQFVVHVATCCRHLEGAPEGTDPLYPNPCVLQGIDQEGITY